MMIDLARMRRLRRPLSPDISFDRVWAELNDPNNWPTPRSTIEAIMLGVRERGVAALKEPDNRERLSRCDAAALNQIDKRVRKLLPESAYDKAL
jgi:hypothetical protein